MLTAAYFKITLGPISVMQFINFNEPQEGQRILKSPVLFTIYLSVAPNLFPRPLVLC